MPDDPPATPLRDTVWRLDFDVSPEANLRFDAERSRRTDVLTELLRPDAFAGDWYGWLTNQASHVLVGAVLAMLLSLRFALLAAAGGYGLVEVAQLALHGLGLWADGLADLGFAALGAGLVVAWWAGRVRLFFAGLVAAVVALVGGAGRRRD